MVAKFEFLGLEGCSSQLSPGWLMLAQPFLDSLFSPHLELGGISGSE